MTVVCQVSPNARESACAGWSADERGRRVLRIRLASAPIEGRANRELVRFLADYLGCGRGAVELLRGESSRLKTVRIPDEAAGRLPPE